MSETTKQRWFTEGAFTVFGLCFWSTFGLFWATWWPWLYHAPTTGEIAWLVWLGSFALALLAVNRLTPGERFPL